MQLDAAAVSPHVSLEGSLETQDWDACGAFSYLTRSMISSRLHATGLWAEGLLQAIPGAV